MAFESQHDTVVLYHKNCLDGLAAAWVVWKAYGFQVDTVAVQYGDDFDAIFGNNFASLIGKKVICVDFAFTLSITKYLMSICSLLVLDHHDSALKELAPIAEKFWKVGRVKWDEVDGEDGGSSMVVVDTRHSGAMLAWNWFFAVGMPKDMPCPPGIQYAEDYDLWKFKFEQTRSWVAAAFSYDMNVETFDRVVNKDVQDMVKEGVAIQRHIDKTVRGLARSAHPFVMDEYEVPVVNANSLFRNELGALLAVGVPFSVTYSDGRDGRQYSLRSIKNAPTSVNVAAIAERFGGGGHANSSAFRISFDDDQFHSSHLTLTSKRHVKQNDEWVEVPRYKKEH